MANRKQMWNNYGGYQTFYPEGLSYYGEDAYYEYYYQPTVNYNNFCTPNAYFQQNTNSNEPKLSTHNRSRENSVMDKSSLFRKPAATTSVNNNYCNYQKPMHQSPAKWTDQYWQKQDKDLEFTTKTQTVQQNVTNPANQIEKILNEMLAQPVQMSKGKSMLEKMGWTGGGLGKDGDGIVEPIAPKATYASQTMGLGLLTELNGQLNPPTVIKSQLKTGQLEKSKGARKAQFTKKKNKNKIPEEQPIDLELHDDDLEFTNYFRKNLLLKLLEFVKNNKKIEIKFDQKLSKYDRKRIHQFIETVRECEDVDSLDFDESEKEIMLDIMAHNNYVLCTESTGRRQNRCLSLYKEAPDMVYITTPHYLREERDDANAKDFEISIYIDESKKKINCSEQTKPNDMATDKTSNLDSDVTDNKTRPNTDNTIDTDNKGNLNNNWNKQLDDNKANEITKPLKPEVLVLKKIIDFFKEFANQPIHIYEEFRFLGSFNKREAAAVKLFFDICMKISVDCEEATELLRVLEHESYVFRVDFDCNGNLVVFKSERTK